MVVVARFVKGQPFAERGASPVGVELPFSFPTIDRTDQRLLPVVRVWTMGLSIPFASALGPSLCSLRAFTLSELLIVLAVFAVLATFALPKVLQSSQTAQEKAIAKETIAALNAAFYKTWQDGGLTQSNVNERIIGNLQYARYCTQQFTQGCRTVPYDSFWGPGVQDGGPALVLHNGTTIRFWSAESANAQGLRSILIDINGNAGPNQRAVDEFRVYAIFDLSQVTTCQPAALKKEGTASPNNCFVDIESQRYAELMR